MTNWKAIAIVFICLFTLETLVIGWSVNLALQEEDNANDCLYNYCSEYPDAYYDAGVCQCYNIDDYGQYELAKESYYK